MIKNPPSTTFSPGFAVLASMVLLAALSRLLPHPPNFSPVEAIALFGGAYFVNRFWAVAVPLIGMFVSDLALGLLYGGWYFDYFISAHFLLIYLCIALSALLGFGLRGRVSSGRVLGYSLAGSLLFFLVTNFGVWLTANAIDTHPACQIGLGACYLAGVPFFQWTVYGTLFYSAVLFGGFELLRRWRPSVVVQTM